MHPYIPHFIILCMQASSLVGMGFPIEGIGKCFQFVICCLSAFELYVPMVNSQMYINYIQLITRLVMNPSVFF